MVTTPQDLVVSDMSLPYGGLFDVAHDWKPLDRPPQNSGIGHWTHRRGTEVDLSHASVPLTGQCGPRPPGQTGDPTWKQTKLWTDENLLINTGFKRNDLDPGHLTEK